MLELSGAGRRARADMSRLANRTPSAIQKSALIIGRVWSLGPRWNTDTEIVDNGVALAAAA